MGLWINVRKTAAMSMNSPDKPEVSIYGEQIQIVNSSKYLGVVFTEEETGANEFQVRLNQGYAKLVTLKLVIQ